MKYLLAILIFGIIVMVHEFGHFFTAKLFDIKVNKFAIGMGPSIIKKQRGETEYSVRLFPIGGFCAMEGEDAESESDRAFGKKPVWQRMIVIVAGAFMNFILGFLVLIIITCSMEKMPLMSVNSFKPADAQTEAEDFYEHESGLKAGDEIEKINGVAIFTHMDINYAMTLGKDGHDFVVERDGREIEINNVMFSNTKSGERTVMRINTEGKNPINVVTYSAKTMVSTVKLVWNSLIGLVTGQYGMNDMSGPVGVVKEMGNAADAGESAKDSALNLLSLISMITINLGVFNLLPVPALDGGRFFFLLVEAIRRKPIKPEHEGMVHMIGMLLLFGLIIVVTFNDIMKLFG